MITFQFDDGRIVPAQAVRIHRDAISIKYFLLVEGEWCRIFKGRNKEMPSFKDFQWEDPTHPFGWSLPITLDQE